MAYVGKLCGVDNIAVQDLAEDWRDLVFPVEAYVAALRELNFPLPEGWERFEESPDPEEAGADSLNKGETDTAELEQSLAPNDAYEVVPGVTLGALRSLLDLSCEGETFRPVLLAAVRTGIKIDAMKRDAPQFSFRFYHGKSQRDAEREEANKELADLKCWDPLKPIGTEKISKSDVDRVCSILRLSRMNKNGKPT